MAPGFRSKPALRATMYSVVAALLALRTSSAQTPVTRTDAIDAAIRQGARLALARADTAVAYAALVSARAIQNPAFSPSYSKSVPTYHYILDLPLDLPLQRSARIGSARAGRLAAQYRFTFERAGAALDADTTYTRAIAARDKARLSRRNAQDADSLRRIVVARRDAGDASDLDVELATVGAGQVASAAAADSLAYMSAVLDLQIVMGLAADQVAITPTDSLVPPPPPSDTTDGINARALPPLQVAAAQADVEASRLNARFQRRSIISGVSLMAGVEQGDPGQTGLLPTFGISLPIPLFNRNRGPIMQAQAEQQRAQATLTLAEVESRTEITRARRELAIATAKVQRDRLLFSAANRVAAMSLTAYREGAAPLASVLEAQRSARDVLATYIDDLADAWIFAAELRVRQLTPDRAQ